MNGTESSAAGISPRAARWAVLGAISALTAVTVGAFGAHALRGRIPPEHLVALETGVRYQMFHALARFAVAWASDRKPNALTTIAGYCFSIGTFLFSGSLYAIAITGIRGFGAATPVGGIILIAGWIFFAAGLWRARRR